MQLSDLTEIVTAPGPFVTVLAPSESDVEQAADRYELVWKDIVRELSQRGVDDRTIAAVESARGEHSDGASRLVIASPADGSVKLAVSLETPARNPLVDVSALPHLLPLIDEAASRVAYVVAAVDREGAEVWASSDGRDIDRAESHDRPGTVEQPTTRGQARRDQRSTDNSWRGTEMDAAATIQRMANAVGAELVLLAGETKALAGVRGLLGPELQEKVVEIAGSRHRDGSEPILRDAVSAAVSRHAAMRLLGLLDDYAQERGQLKRGCDGVADVVAALRKAQVRTLILTTGLGPDATLWFGPEPAQLGVTAQEVLDLGTDDAREGPLVDVLLRTSIATGADVQLVPGELDSAPREGVGALLRYADDL